MFRFLPIKICLFFCLISCSLKTTEGLREESRTQIEVQNPYFSNPKIDYVYKSKIEVYNRNFGGILIIKKLHPNHHRLVMTTEFGSKLLDFEFKNGEFIKNFVLEALDKRMVLNVLKRDFRLLIQENNPIQKHFTSEKYHVFKIENRGRKNFYFISKDSHILDKIISASKSKEKVRIDFYSENGKTADSIFIKHQNIRLEIGLKKIN